MMTTEVKLPQSSSAPFDRTLGAWGVVGRAAAASQVLRGTTVIGYDRHSGLDRHMQKGLRVMLSPSLTCRCAAW